MGGAPLSGGRRGSSIKTLKKILKKAGLKTSGRKGALTRRAKKAGLKMGGGDPAKDMPPAAAPAFSFPPTPAPASASAPGPASMFNFSPTPATASAPMSAPEVPKGARRSRRRRA